MEKIKKSGFKLYWIADKVDISRQALGRKIRGEADFRISEVQKLSELLNLSSEDRDKLFFFKKDGHLK